MPLDQPRKKAMAYLGQVANNEDPQLALDALKASVTVAELRAAYITGHAKPKKSSWRNDESVLRRNLIPEYGTRLAPNAPRRT